MKDLLCQRKTLFVVGKIMMDILLYIIILGSVLIAIAWALALGINWLIHLIDENIIGNIVFLFLLGCMIVCFATFIRDRIRAAKKDWEERCK